MTIQIETALCVECGVDTRINGYVNRVPRDTGIIDGYNCGCCQDTWDEAVENADNVGVVYSQGGTGFERSIDDDMYETYEKERHAEVEAMFPDAPAFREWCQKDSFASYITNENLSDVQVKQIQALVDNYRYEVNR